MKKTPLRRGKGLTRKREMTSKAPTRHAEPRRTRTPGQGKGRRSSRLVASRKRRAKLERFARQFHSRERVEFVAGLPCERCGRGPCENHHEPPRSRGGTFVDISPLCADCHRLGPGARHRVGPKRFWRALGKDPAATNAATQAAWSDSFNVVVL